MPQEQFLLRMSFWGPFHAVQSAAVQAVLGMRCRPPGRGWLPGEVSCWRAARLAPAVHRGHSNTYTPVSVSHI